MFSGWIGWWMGSKERPKNQTVIADGQKEGVRTGMANKLHFFFRSKAVCCDLLSEVLHLAVELDTQRAYDLLLHLFQKQ